MGLFGGLGDMAARKAKDKISQGIQGAKQFLGNATLFLYRGHLNAQKHDNKNDKQSEGIKAMTPTPTAVESPRTLSQVEQIRALINARRMTSSDYIGKNEDNNKNEL